MPDFLVLRYSDYDFLCPAEDILASTVRQVQGGSVSYGDLFLKEIDLDKRLRSLFPQLSQRQVGLSLICRSDKIYSSNKKRTNGGDELVALRVGSDSFVAAYSFSEFRLLPYLVRDALKRKGFLAARFFEKRVQYLLYLPDLLGDEPAGEAAS